MFRCFLFDQVGRSAALIQMKRKLPKFATGKETPGMRIRIPASSVI